MLRLKVVTLDHCEMMAVTPFFTSQPTNLPKHYTSKKVLVLRVTSDQTSRPLLFPIPLYSGMCLAVGYETGGEHCCWALTCDF